MSEEKKSSLAGILGGIAAIITAFGGIYVAMQTSGNLPPVSKKPDNPSISQPDNPSIPQPPLAPKTFDSPRVGGSRLDSTTWDFPGGDASVYRQQAANAFCKYSGYKNSSKFGFEDLGPNQNLNRFWNDGRLKLCDFCGVPFTYINCE
jgi:hypothetical protein